MDMKNRFLRGLMLLVGFLVPDLVGADLDRLSLRFFADTYEEDAGWNGIRGSVLWLNDEPVGYVKRGSALDVVGFPIARGNNRFRLDRGGGVQVAVLTTDGLSFLKIENGAFFVPDEGGRLLPFDGGKVSGVDVDAIKADVRRLLEMIVRGDPSAVDRLFEDGSDAFSKGLQRGIFGQRKWVATEVAEVDEMRVSIGSHFLLVHPGEGDDTLLFLDGGRVSFNMRYVLFFVNASNEVAVYSPKQAPGRGFVFKRETGNFGQAQKGLPE